MKRRARKVSSDDGQSHTLHCTLQSLSGLKVDEALEVSAAQLRDIGFIMRGAVEWTATDLIMGGSVDNAFLITASTDAATGSIVFTRRSYPPERGDLRTWVAPGKRNEFVQRADGYWESRRRRISAGE